MAFNTFAAIYYDGRTSERWPVEVEINDNTLRITGSGISRIEAFKDLTIEPQVGHLRGQIRLADGAMCEVEDGKALMAAIPAPHQQQAFSFIHKIENKLHYILMTLVLAITIIWGLIEYGVPVMARSVAQAIPMAMEKTMGEQVLTGMDKFIFEPSELPIERVTEIRNKFDRFIKNNTGDYHYNILFRKSEEIGANAFALPSGIIVFTDEMVKLAKDDRELIAVLAHEIGHVEQRHTIRHVLQDSITVVLLVMVTGDVESATSLVATLPTLLVQAKFSRQFESEADAYAADVLQKQDMSPHWLGAILARLDEINEEEKNSKSIAVNEKDKKSESITNYLSSHPPTPERIKHLKELKRRPD